MVPSHKYEMVPLLILKLNEHITPFRRLNYKCISVKHYDAVGMINSN